MIGILIVTHGGIAERLAEAAVAIASDSERLAAVGLDWNEDAGHARRRIEEGLAAVDAGEGVLILTDMFGGTPSNLALPFLQENRVEIVTGVNLPMLVRSLAGRREESLASLARAVRDRGRKAIEVASALLAVTPRAEP
jgi:PTS system mannose-specific IIA component